MEIIGEFFTAQINRGRSAVSNTIWLWASVHFTRKVTETQVAKKSSFVLLRFTHFLSNMQHFARKITVIEVDTPLCSRNSTGWGLNSNSVPDFSRYPPEVRC